MQPLLFGESQLHAVAPFRAQLLKWVGNKQRFSHEIVSYFPETFGTYFEPFLGSGAVLGTLAPQAAEASDVFAPLIEIWEALRQAPIMLTKWYTERFRRIHGENKVEVYEAVKAAYNKMPNGADLLFICRLCYGGIVRFRKADGFISTPCGPHSPMPPAKFARRVEEWRERTRGTSFRCCGYEEAMDRACGGDLIYCDPPYSDSQTILYGAQTFDLDNLFRTIERCKRRGVAVVLSIDGTKKSGDRICHIKIPDFLFAREVYVHCGRSMLRRFQMPGQSLEGEVVHDRLLLTY